MVMSTICKCVLIKLGMQHNQVATHCHQYYITIIIIVIIILIIVVVVFVVITISLLPILTMRAMLCVYSDPHDLSTSPFCTTDTGMDKVLQICYPHKLHTNLEVPIWR